MLWVWKISPKNVKFFNFFSTCIFQPESVAAIHLFPGLELIWTGLWAASTWGLLFLTHAHLWQKQMMRGWQVEKNYFVFNNTINVDSKLVQYSQCIWDKDTDSMLWYPSEIDVCNSKYRETKLIRKSFMNFYLLIIFCDKSPLKSWRVSEG